MVNERSALLDKNQSLPRHVTDRGIIDELSNLVFAGTDTSGNSMTYLFWELAKHPEWQTRLREELKHAVGDQANPPYSAISELPVLEAVVQETFRLHPAAPDGLLRVVPEEGGVIDGVVVPPKVRRKIKSTSHPSQDSQQRKRKKQTKDFIQTMY